MTNYAGLEPLRTDVATLANEMSDLFMMLNELEHRCGYGSGSLAERLIRQTISRVNALYMEAYREVLALDACFKD